MLVRFDRPRFIAIAGTLAWTVVLLGLIAFFILSPQLFSRPAHGLQLGPDLPIRVLADPRGELTIDQVAALPDAAFSLQDTTFNRGFTSTVYWIKAAAPPEGSVGGAGTSDPPWLEVLPTSLDLVTLYQPADGRWQAQSSGDTVAMSQRVHVRQLVFPLRAGTPLVLRVQSLSSMQVYGTVWRSSELMAYLSSNEWASGVHLGISLVLALLILGAAMALRMRSLTALAVLSIVILLHTTNARGYLQVWLPPSWARWNDAATSVGTFVLPATFAWQARELLTRGTLWRRIDACFLVLVAAPLLALSCSWLGRIAPWLPLGVDVPWRGPVAVTVPWLVSTLSVIVTWTQLRRQGPTLVGILMATPYSLHMLLGLHIAAAFSGLVTLPADPGLFWQLEALLLNILVAVAVGASLVQRFRDSRRRQMQLVRSLEKSEQTLEERVRQRTDELLHVQNALQAALHSEREMRLEQRQFFNMVNHEFRTPLAVVDSAAAEQQAFPSADLAVQQERAEQIRRACRRLSALADNCLTNDRLDNAAFRLQLDWTPVHELVSDAVQLVQWSRRHHLALDIAPRLVDWNCDPTLVRIALSNLVDNAVKYAREGEIAVAARLDAQGSLELSVSDQGPGLPLEMAKHIFERYERGERLDQARGFGLGLWVARRVARLHGGDVRVGTSARGGTCFTLTLPLRPDVPEPPASPRQDVRSMSSG
ncbi:MAG: ATP-binding protein [Pseudorhodoferax sp.]